MADDSPDSTAKPHMKKTNIHQSISRLARVSACGLLVLAGSAWANNLHGVVRDANGKRLSGADVKISGNGYSKTVKSDSEGKFSAEGLNGKGTYQVSLIVGGTTKASIKNVVIKPSEPTELNFDLKKESAGTAAAKKGKHFVYVPATTGSHMGGRWVEVDDNGDAATASNQRVEKADQRAFSRMQQNSGAQRGGN